MTEVLGADAARQVLEHWTGDPYTWIYRTVLQDQAALIDLLRRHNLLPHES